MAVARTVEFQNPEPPAGYGIDLGPIQPKLGVTGKVTFRQNALDRKAITAEKTKQELLGRASASTAAASRADTRITAIELLLAEVQEDEARLTALVQSRLVEQYKEGDEGDIRFLLSGDGLSDLIVRGRVLNEQSAHDRRVLAEYEVTVAKVRQYKQLLEELRDINGEQSRDLRDRADRAVRGQLQAASTWLASARARPVLADPSVLVARRGDEVAALVDRSRLVLGHRLDRAGDDISHVRARVRALSPAATLERGYAVVQDDTGAVVRVAGDDVTIGPDTWTRYVNGDETRRSLVRTGSGITYVVTGTGDWPEIEGFTATLRAG